MSKLKNFRAMWDAYPQGEAEEVKERIGGSANADSITNTCVIRVSRSFNASGNTIPGGHDGLYAVKGDDGKYYAIRVKEFAAYLRAAYGAPQESFTYEGEGGPVPEDFVGKHGVIYFDVEGWDDATGHFNLWDGERCAHHDYFERAARVYLWTVPDGDGRTQPATDRTRLLSASVGARGVNRPDDVRAVQNLLVSFGIDVTVDGRCGPGTIAAIREFQKRFATSPDGRVNPGGRTLQELLRR